MRSLITAKKPAAISLSSAVVATSILVLAGCGSTAPTYNSGGGSSGGGGASLPMPSGGSSGGGSSGGESGGSSGGGSSGGGSSGGGSSAGGASGGGSSGGGASGGGASGGGASGGGASGGGMGGASGGTMPTGGIQMPGMGMPGAGGAGAGGEGGTECQDGGIAGGGIGGGAGCDEGIGQFPGDPDRAEQLGEELDKSVGDFDEAIGEEQRQVSSVGRDTEGFGDGTGGGGGSIGLGEQAAGASGGGGGYGSGAGGGVSGEQQQAGPLDGMTEEQKQARTPEDIEVGAFDDVVARQIREAALAEDDPERRERYWEEYRKYKGLK